MQYICLFCESMGASGERASGPATYNCHVCGEQHGMWPKELAQKHLHLVSVLRRQGSDATDRLVIAKLQRDLNTAKEKLRNNHDRHKFDLDQKDHLIAKGLKIVDEMLPQIGKLVMDVGVINDFCFRARPVPKPESK